MYNDFMFFNIPYIPNDKVMRPPLLYDLMNSIVNFGKDEKTNLSNIPSVARETIFNFTYPLSENVNKEEFETLILKKFIMRRIGFETYTAWHIALEVKLNEIMPYYNKIFDTFKNWNIFEGETGTKQGNVINNKNTNANSEVDSRYSKLPQNEIQDVRNGTYMTDYTLGQNKANSTENDNNNYNETYSKTNPYKMESFLKFIENKNKTMTLIYNDLDTLFYGIANTN